MDQLLRLAAGRIGEWVGLALSVMGGASLLLAWALGWCYVLSPGFRAAVRAGWRGQPRIAVVAASVLGIVFFLLANCMAVFLAFVAWGTATS